MVENAPTDPTPAIERYDRELEVATSNLSDPIPEERNHRAVVDENDDLPLDQELVVATSNLSMLTREEDVEIAILASKVQPSHDPVAPSAQEETHRVDDTDEDDDVSLTRVFYKGQKRKDAEPSAPTTCASAPLPKKDLTEGENDPNNEAESLHQANQENFPEQLTKETALPVREEEENHSQAVQANDQPSTLPQEPAQVEEVASTIVAEPYQSPEKEASGGHTEVVHTSSDSDDESSVNPPIRSNDAPTEDAPESNHESFESFSSNDSSGG
nr:hypothetical protein Iba_chr10fCG5700 [Ipomoea batatas]